MSIDIGSRSFSLRTSGSYSSLDQVRDTVVAAVDGRIVRVRDIATVSWDTQPYSYVGRFNGKRAVFVTANQKEGYNILQVRDRIESTLQKFETGLPKRIELQRGFDQSRNVGHRLSRLYIDFGIAIALVLLTLLPLGWRAAGIVMISIPLSLAFGLAMLYFLGYSLNQLSIAGFVVALGLLVDDSIVVTENIARHLREGYSRTAAALAGTRQIFVAILGCTATLIFAFLPLMALPGTAGKFIRVLPMTVVMTIIGSLLIALFIIPFLASRVLKEKEDEHGNVFLQRVMGVIHRYYRPALHYCLARPRATVFVAIGGSMLLSAALVPVIGSSLFPKADTPQFLIAIEAPNGASLSETDRALHFVEDRLRQMPEVKSWFANLGHGNPADLLQPHRAQRLTELRRSVRAAAQLQHATHSAEARRVTRSAERLSRRHASMSRSSSMVRPSPRRSQSASSDANCPPSRIWPRASRSSSRRPREPAIRSIHSRWHAPICGSIVDSQKASMLGVPTVEFDRAVRLSVAGIPAGTFKDPSGEQYDIIVRTPVGTRADLRTLGEVRVPSLSGATLPISQLATLEFERAPTQIQRYDRERAVVINSDVELGYNTAKVTAAVVERLNAMDWPRGYHYVLGGEAESGAESFKGIGTATIVALFGIFAVLVLEFGNFKSTLIVLTVVPLGVFGGFLALLATGNSHFIHRQHRLHRTDRYRDQEFHPAGGFHQSIARGRRTAGRSDRAGRRDSFSSHPADLRHGHWRSDAAGRSEHRTVLADVVGHHRRADLVNTAGATGYTRRVQTDSTLGHRATACRAATGGHW